MKLIERYASWVGRHWGSLSVVSFLIAMTGLYYSVLLYKDLRTDLEELLPETAQSVIDIRSVANRVGGLNHLSIFIESPHPEKTLQFMKDVSAELKKLPTDLVARVEDNILREKEFFTANKSLYIDLQDWKDIDRYVSERIRWERTTTESNPFSLGLSDDEEKTKPKEYDFTAFEEKYKKRAESMDRFPNGYFTSRDGRSGVVLAFLPGKVTDEKANERLSKAAHDIVNRLNPKTYDPLMIVGYDGDVQNMIEEHEGLMEDLELSTVVVLLLVTMVLLIYFRSFAGVYALSAALLAGTFATFGVSYFLIGYLNANTAFLGSIVVGNGINFGIIFLARYIEERRRGQNIDASLTRTMRFTLQATWVAAMAAGLSYGSLMITDFRGFNQFGVIGGIGMLLCWIATFTVLPALLVGLDRRGWLKAENKPLKESAFVGPVADLVLKYPKPVVLVTLASVLVCGALCFRFSEDTLESDFSKLRNKKSMLHGSGYWGRRVDSIFERYLTPTAILTENASDAQKVAQKLVAFKDQDGPESPIAEIKVLEDFLPQDQEEKLKIMDHLRSQLTPRVMRHMRNKDRARVKELLPDEPLKTLTIQDLPEGIKVHFREVNGTLGHMVHVYPRMAGEGNFWNGREVIRFAKMLRSSIEQAGVKAAIAGQPPLSADMITAISTDGPKATLLAFAAVSMLVILVFRQWILIRSVLGALLLGVLWMAGVMAAYRLRVNFLNFIALPITFGIGVDYAVNIFSRYQSDRQQSGGKADIADAIHHTGGAVALCSLTTIIGYSSLLIASSQAFVSFGVLAVLGEVTCLIAALVALPAIWRWRENSKRPPTRRFMNDSSVNGPGDSLQEKAPL